MIYILRKDNLYHQCLVIFDDPDKDNENIVIKNVTSKTECKNTKMISEIVDFVPRFYGCYTYNDIKLRPKYKKPGQFDEIKTENIYLVMEKINGRSLDDSTFTFEEKINLLRNNIDIIYSHYITLCDAGINLGDLFCRNIMMTDDGKIYFIDFEDDYISFGKLNEETQTYNSIPEYKRHTKESLLETMEYDLRETNHNGDKLKKINQEKINQEKINL